MRTGSEFLTWMANRLVDVYHESPNVDFVQRLYREAETHKTLLNACKFALKRCEENGFPQGDLAIKLRDAIEESGDAQ